jgi:hypothetical protein
MLSEAGAVNCVHGPECANKRCFLPLRSFHGAVRSHIVADANPRALYPVFCADAPLYRPNQINVRGTPFEIG